MARIGEKIRSLVQTSMPFDETRREFNRINLDTAADTLNIRDRAREIAASGLPSKDDESKDEIATNIDYYISEVINESKNQLSAILAAGKLQASSKLELSDDKVSIKMEANECESALRKEAKIGLQKIFGLKRDLYRTESECDEFREKNHRVGPAKYPTPSEKSRILGVVLIIFGIELFLNSWVLGDAYPSGIVGVMVEVLLFAFVNLFIAWSLGHFVLREIRHVKPSRKYIGGYIAGLTLLFLIVSVNLFFAHYRDAIAALPATGYEGVNFSELGATAWQSIQSHPFEMQDFKAYLLWFAGIVLVLWSSFKVFTTDDPYPNYGGLQRFQERLSAKYTSECNTYLSNTTKIVSAFHKGYKDKLLLHSRKRESASGWAVTHKAILSRYQDWLHHLEGAGAALYKIYRTENLMARNDGLTELPAFSIPFSLPSIASKPIDGSCDVVNPEPENHSDLENLYIKFSSEFKKRLELYHALLKDIQNFVSDDESFKTLDTQLSSEDVVAKLMQKCEINE